MLFRISRRFGIGHVAIVIAQLLVHMLGGMSQQVAVLVDRAPLDGQIVAPERHDRHFQPRRAVDDHKLGTIEAALIQIFEKLTSCGGALAPHIHNRYDLIPANSRY